jgi:HKD family nuclease
MITIIHNPNGPQRLGDLLVERLQSNAWTSFRAAVAFAKRSGVKHLVAGLSKFAAHADVKISVGIDHFGTSAEAISDLLASLGQKGEVWLFHNRAISTFHPKVYLFANPERAECFVGSGNLTEGGLFTNYEFVVSLTLDRANPDDAKVLAQIEDVLAQWCDGTNGLALRLTPEMITALRESGDLPTEEEINIQTRQASKKAAPNDKLAEPKKFFATVPIPSAPSVDSGRSQVAQVIAPAMAAALKLPAPAQTGPTGFVITLQRTDVGVGQTTRGASRRSPELFLPKVCVRDEPKFWGWPDLFKPDPKYSGFTDRDGFSKMDREGVRMRLGSETLSVHWWYNPDKKDYRLRSERLRSAGHVGDILKIELAHEDDAADYYVEIIPMGAPDFPKYEALCTKKVTNSPKKYGYY